MLTISGLKKHLIVGLIIRLLLIIYGEIQDQISEVPYTDIDYRVVTDSSRHVYNLGSPFQRHTYRYTPFLAIFLIPNIHLHQSFGKLLFVFFDIIIAVIIKNIVVDEIHSLIHGSQQYLLSGDGKVKVDKKSVNNSSSLKPKNRFLISKKESRVNLMLGDRLKFEKMGNFAAQIWIYNPLTMVIATRGNGDAISCALVLLSIYYLLKSNDFDAKSIERNVILSGIFHGLAIHFRLYPIFFSLAFFLFLSHRKEQNGSGGVFDCILKPNRKQTLFVISVAATLFIITGIFFAIYKYEFIQESIIYHFVRKDTRHNFSLFFYVQYLSSVNKVNVFQKLLMSTPQMILIILISFHFTKTRQTFQFALLLIAFITVSYNSVITSQYFVWFLSLLPLSINNFKNLTFKQTILLPSLWMIGQGIWLLFAYFLEFKGINSFDFIWLASAIFFIINIVIVQVLISNYDDLSVKIK